MGTGKKRLQALIMAAGYATRLYPLTKQCPKPLLRVNGRPIIEHIIDKFCEVDELDELIVVTNAKFISAFRAWLKGFRCRKPIVLVNDRTRTNETRLGAIGDMAFVLKNHPLSGDLLVAGGDNIFDHSVTDFLAYARRHANSPAMGVYDIGSKSAAANYGVIKLDKAGRITDFKEKPASPRSSLVAMCLYYFPRSRVGLIEDYLASKEHKSDAMGFYIDWLRRKLAVYGYVFKGRWYDIGDRAYLDEAQRTFK